MKLLILLTLLFLSVSNQYSNLPSTNSSIPHDLIFIAWNPSADVIAPYILLFQGSSGQVSTFYSSPSGGGVVPIAWSPKGDMLAVVIFGEVDTAHKFVKGPILPTDGHVCILTRTGELQICMQQRIPGGLVNSGNGGYFNDYYFSVFWSQKEDSVYFVTLLDGPNRLIEASIKTGDTLRTVYSGADLDVFTSSWSVTAQTLLMESRDSTALSNTSQLLSISNPGSTTKAVEIARAIPITTPTATLDANDTQQNSHFQIPCGFSPQGHYMAAHDYNTEVPQAFFILNASGMIYQTLMGSVIPNDCPSWSPDEKSFYFDRYWRRSTGASHLPSNAETETIYNYDLATQSTRIYYSGSKASIKVNSVFSVASDGKYLAFDTYDNPEYAKLHPNDVESRIGIVGAGGSLTFVSGPSLIGKTALWVPDLQP